MMDDSNPEDIEIDLEAIYHSTHARERQQQRDINSHEAHAAIKYGSKEASPEFGIGRWKYTWGSIVVITNDDSSDIITVYKVSSTRVHVQKATITKEMKERHDQALERLKDHSTWTSHTVAVIDTSGSMRTDDTAYNITRSELVWLTLAVTFVAKSLKSGERTESDVFSLVGMQKDRNVIFTGMPFDWILYNKLVDMQRTHLPLGHGEYFPALKAARSLLMANRFGGCALALLFLSDGMPSDKLPKGGIPHRHTMKLEISDLASRIGSRLSVWAMALGKDYNRQEFATLKAMVHSASIYGCQTLFEKPSLSAHILGTALTKLTSTTTAIKAELGSRVCRYFQKEPMANVGNAIQVNQNYQYVEQKSFLGVRNGESVVQWSIRKTRWDKKEGWVSLRRDLTFLAEDAIGVGIKKLWFGEGTERLVKEFREVGPGRFFVGPVMVAKDTKYVTAFDGREKLEAEKDFHQRFIKCQILADKCAQYFRRQLARHPAIDSSVFPIIEFLECWVYMIQPDVGERQAYLVEKMLDVENYKFQKWNDNRGGVKLLGRFQPSDLLLETILDESRNSDDDSDSSQSDGDADLQDVDVDQNPTLEKDETSFSVDDIPQAFSCFTHWFSQGHFVVCDLQGVYNTSLSPPTFELTDPVIHHRKSTDDKRIYGRTDHGVDGIEAFLKTHRCCNLCRMVRAYAYIPWVQDEVKFSGEEVEKSAMALEHPEDPVKCSPTSIEEDDDDDLFEYL